MKRKTLLLFVSLMALAALLPGCKRTPPCRYCPLSPGQNNLMDALVDVTISDGRRRTFRLDVTGCAIGFSADPKKGETCTVTQARVRRDPGLRPRLPFDLNAPPPVIRFELNDGAELLLDATYWLPVAEYWDQYGNYIGSGTTTALSPDGTWMESAPPDLSGVYSGTYRVEVSNLYWDGQRQLVASGEVSCYGRDMRDADGDGWSPDAYYYMERDCDDYNPSVYPGAWVDCNGAYYYYDQNCNGTYDYDECWGGGNTCCGPGCYCY